MNRISTARVRIDQAGDLPSLLGAAYGAFEEMLAVIRQHEERDEGSFAAFVIAACAAANGRDCIAGAPSLPPSAVTGPASGTDGLLAELTVARVALTVAGLSEVLAARLTAAAVRAAEADDRIACTNAARQARRIWRLFAGAREP